MFTRHRIAAGLLLVSLASAAPAPGRAAAAAEVLISGGASLPFGDLADLAKTGAMGSVGVEFGGPSVRLGVDGTFIRNGVSDSYEAFLAAVNGAPVPWNATVLGGGLHATWFPRAKGTVHPYATVGVGLYNVHEESSSGGQSTVWTDNAGGARVGLGLRAKATEAFDVLGEGDFHLIGTRDGSTNFLAVMFGVSIHLTRH